MIEGLDLGDRRFFYGHATMPKIQETESIQDAQRLLYAEVGAGSFVRIVKKTTVICDPRQWVVDDYVNRMHKDTK